MSVLRAHFAIGHNIHYAKLVMHPRRRLVDVPASFDVPASKLLVTPTVLGSKTSAPTAEFLRKWLT